VDSISCDFEDDAGTEWNGSLFEHFHYHVDIQRVERIDDLVTHPYKHYGSNPDPKVMQRR
jgi:hypothetical protein